MPSSPWAPALALAAITGIVCSSSPASATVVKALSLLEKTEVAPVVLHGIVDRVETRWVVPGQRVETVVTVVVLEAIKGAFEPKDRVVFRRGGGTIDGFSQTAPGLSEYESGEEVILFLEPLGADLVAIGVGIGKYGVQQRGEGKFVTHDPDVAVVRYDRVSAEPIGIKPHTAMVPEALPEFLDRLRSYARGVDKVSGVDPTKGLILKPTPARKR